MVAAPASPTRFASSTSASWRSTQSAKQFRPPRTTYGLCAHGYVLGQVPETQPQEPKWFPDRFVLSAGHGCMLLYALLHLTGYDSVTLEDIKNFRQWGSKTPGHPETFETAGVEVTTGPLGQGIANAVGLAMAEAHLAAKFNKPDCKVVDHTTYVIMGDGCHQEGVSGEAASLAGHLGLRQVDRPLRRQPHHYRR